MRENVYHVAKSLPRMSWNPKNLYNLHERSNGSKNAEFNFTSTSKSLFQQQWIAKRLSRAYHGDYIQESRFQNHLLPASLPAVSASTSSSRRQSTHIPVGSLMFAKLEARLDVLIFRACFAPSVYRARQMVIHGKVKVNGDKVTNPNTILQPGSMFSVDPRAIDMLRMHASTSKKTAELASTIANDSRKGKGKPSPAASEAAQEDADSPPEEPTKDYAAFDLSSSSLKTLQDTLPFHLPDYAAPFLFIPAYLEVNFPTCSAIYIRHPTAGPGYSEVPTPYEADGEVVRLTWEWYNKVGKRRKARSKAGNDFKLKKDTSHIFTGAL